MESAVGKLTSCTILDKPFLAALLPTPQENSLFVEQASCLFLTMVQHLTKDRDSSNVLA